MPSYSPFSVDGIVIDSSAVGDPVAEGSIMAHEVGHWLGLDHTFSGSSCDSGDEIDDTPKTDKPGYNWLSSSDACNIRDSTTAFVRCGNTVMVRNVMDYNYERCRQYFSKQQAAIMRGNLLNPGSSRFTLQTSPALAPSCPAYDCFGKSCGPDGCGGTCETCPGLNSCSGTGICRSTVPLNIDCKSAEGFTQSTSGYSITKDNNGVINNPTSCNTTSQRIPGALWYYFVATATGNASITTSGSTIDTTISIYLNSGCNNCARGGFNDDASILDNTSALRLNVVAGTYYSIVVSGKAGTRGRIRTNMIMSGSAFCTPTCGNRKCGADGCGGLCGTCQANSECDIHSQCVLKGILSTSTATSTPANSPAASSTQSLSPSNTPAPSVTSAASQTGSLSKTPSISISATRTPTPSRTQTPTVSPTSVASQSQTNTRTPAPSKIVGQTASTSPSISNRASSTNTATGSISRSLAPSNTSAASITSSISSSSQASASSGPSKSRSLAPSNSSVASPTSVASVSNSPVAPSPSASTLCNTTQQCTEKGLTCGTVSICGITVLCGTCSPDKVCSSNKCQCPLGTANTNGQCLTNTTVTGIPNYASEFTQLTPASPIGFAVTGQSLSIVQSGNFLVTWAKSAAVVDKFQTSQSFTIQASSSETLAFACRTGQTGNQLRDNDRLEWRLTDVNGTNAFLSMCLIKNGADQCSSLGPIPFPSAKGLNVTTTMGWDDSNGNILIGLKFNSNGTPYSYSGFTSGTNLPALGSMSFFFSSQKGPRPVLSNLKLSTSVTLTVTLSDCINDANWSELFFSLTKANPATTAVQVRPSQQNANCKGAVHAKGLVSGFSFVVNSFGVPAQSIAKAFATAAAGPQGFAAGISSAGVVPGSLGALEAGLPSSTLVGPGVTGATSVGGIAGAGGSGGGLSGGSIAGIVIGSVGGSILILGVSGVVVAAVVVAAVVIARKETDSSSSPPEESSIPESTPKDEPHIEQQREEPVNRVRGFRGTISRLFGGIDVMNNPAKDRTQSITNRAPPMN